MPGAAIDGRPGGRGAAPLEDSWAWAHVASAVPPARSRGEVEAGGGAVVSRLLCPRRLARPALPRRDGPRLRDRPRPRSAGRRPPDLQPGVGRDGRLARAARSTTPGPSPRAPRRATSRPCASGWSPTPRRADRPPRGRRGRPRLLPPFSRRRVRARGRADRCRATAEGAEHRRRAWFEGVYPASTTRPTARSTARHGVRTCPARDDPVVGPPLYGAGRRASSTSRARLAARRQPAPGEPRRRRARRPRRARHRRPSCWPPRGTRPATCARSTTRSTAAGSPPSWAAASSAPRHARGRRPAPGHPPAAPASTGGRALTLRISAVFPRSIGRGQTVARRLLDPAGAPERPDVARHLRATRPSVTDRRFSGSAPAPRLSAASAQAFVESSAPGARAPDACRAVRRVRARLRARRRAHARGSRSSTPPRPWHDRAQRRARRHDLVRRRARPGRRACAQLDPLASVRAGLLLRISGLGGRARPRAPHPRGGRAEVHGPPLPQVARA